MKMTSRNNPGRENDMLQAVTVFQMTDDMALDLRNYRSAEKCMN